MNKYLKNLVNIFSNLANINHISAQNLISPFIQYIYYQKNLKSLEIRTLSLFMNFQMTIPSITIPESFTTNITSKRPISSMNSNMSV